MKAKTSILISVMAIFLISISAQAVIIDFESQTVGTYLGTSTTDLVIDGFRFDWIGYGNYQKVALFGDDKVAVDALPDNPYGAEVTIYPDSGIPFLFNQLEYGSMTGGSGWWAIHMREHYDGITLHQELHPTTAGLTLTAADLGVEGIWLDWIRINLVSASWDSEFYYDDLDLTPVPEPGTMLLLGSGLAGLVALKRKFRKS